MGVISGAKMIVWGGLAYVVYTFIKGLPTKEVTKYLTKLFYDTRALAEMIGQILGEFYAKYFAQTTNIKLPRANMVMELLFKRYKRDGYLTDQDFKTLLWTYKADEFNKTMHIGAIVRTIVMPISALKYPPKLKMNLTPMNFTKVHGVLEKVKKHEIGVVKLETIPKEERLAKLRQEEKDGWRVPAFTGK